MTDQAVWVRRCTGCGSDWWDHPDDQPILFCLKCQEPLGHFTLVEPTEVARFAAIKAANRERGWRVGSTGQ